MTSQAVGDALTLIADTPGYQPAARRLRRATIVLSPSLPDRAQTSLLGHITLGAEPFGGSADAARVSLAGTLVHEHFHLTQHPLQKTLSFWLGVWTRRHPMLRYEAPAYAAQIEFLRQVSRTHPLLEPAARHEREQVQSAFAFHYKPHSSRIK